MFSLTAWDRVSAASLFDRILRSGSSSSCLVSEAEPDSEDREVETLVDSVKRHLECVLNTRPGSCRSAPELGVIDLNDATQNRSDIRDRIREAIRLCIHHYEPRVIHVVVHSPVEQEDALELSFHVTAHVRLENIEKVTAFNVHMDSQRHYSMV